MGLEGIILKGYSGFYYVWDGTHLWECSLRGKFRLKKQTFLPGDRVEISVICQETKKAVIEKVKPRQTELIRPAIANVELAVIVMSFKSPEPDFWLLDRLLIMVQASLIQPVICFNKVDLVPESQNREIKEIYEKTGFPVLITSSKEKWGLDGIKEVLAGKVAVLAGPSGVGKSSILNALEPGVSLKTGEVSERLDRGKHTTRHVELVRLSSGGLLADTPGFSQVYLPKELKREFLVWYYPDFMKYRKQCRFNTCLHRDEPQCAVREAAQSGSIDFERYQRYLVILEEVIAEERRY